MLRFQWYPRDAEQFPPRYDYTTDQSGRHRKSNDNFLKPEEAEQIFIASRTLMTRLDFGTTFVATDPDGHRLRVFVPAAA
ncbi:hypothetical protein [Bradyrhizobium sp. 190]|uniref:hypothetical protein n=1 Tax=Bradyrhizobium sp. 190 TaxID=2782658 RepID=UPI001FF8DA2C|nr:hypothetical protein [Bradyrhizobium sp. 190]